MSKASDHSPFAQLGDTLKTVREQLRESLAEAAGAVEIAEEDLQQIEQGKQRPSEEILLLLINHFGIKEDDAVRLWEMAGYDAADEQAEHEHGNGKTIVMAIAMDPRVMYSDSVEVTGNKHGVIMNFLQTGSGSVPTMPVSRIGMSREQAKKLAEVLRDTLHQLDEAHKPKQLPESSSAKEDQ